MQLQMAVGDQVKEMVDDASNAVTLAAIMAAPFTGGASLGILAVLAPIGAASSLYNIVNRAMYDDLHLDDESVLDFINIASLGLGKIGELKKGHKVLQMIATASRIAVQLGDAGQYILMSYRTYQEIMKEIPGEAPDAARRRKLLKLLEFIQGVSIPVSTKLLSEAHYKAPESTTPGTPTPTGTPHPSGDAPAKSKADARRVTRLPQAKSDAQGTPDPAAHGGREKQPGVRRA